MTTTTIALKLAGVTPTYTGGAIPRVDILGLQNLPAWAAAGVTYFGRADYLAVPGPAGFKAQLPNLITSSTQVCRVTDTVTGTLTVQPKNAAYLGGQTTFLASDNTDLRIRTSLAQLTATGPHSILVAVHALKSQFQLFGNNNGGLLSATLVGNQIRYALNNSGANLTVDIGVTTYNRNLLIWFIRRADGFLVIRYKQQGQAWVEVVSSSAYPAVAIGTDLNFGAFNVQSGYSPYGYWGNVLFAPNTDMTATTPAATRALIDAYETGYYGMT